LARRFISFWLLFGLATCSWGQAFGRFGYSQAVQFAGMTFDRTGFSANDPAAQKIKFGSSIRDWKGVTGSELEHVVSLTSGSGSPSKIGFNLLSLGASMYFPTGMDLQIGSVGAPYLSWEQGTVSDGIPTPKSPWLLLSFKDRQPPIIIGFLDNPASLQISGTPGNWHIRSAKDYKGWVRVGLPIGLESRLANTPGALGKLAVAAENVSRFFTERSPKLLHTKLEADLHSVTATWEFDHSGAVVPEPAVLANLGNYRLSIKTPIRKLPIWTEDGPVSVVTGNELIIRFPIKRIPSGRAVGVGIEPIDPIATVSPIDIPSVVELALDSLVSERDTLTRKSALEASNEFIGQANFSLEPWTQQQLPYDAYGHGLDLAAAHALLTQASTAASRSTSEANSMLTSVTWRLDWRSWRAWTSDVNIAQRTGALAAVAGALCPEPERRLAAAMFQAGLSGYRGLQVWRRRQELIETEPKVIEPLYGIRKGIFGLDGQPEPDEAFVTQLQSSIRIFSEQPVSLVKRGNEYILQWTAIDATPAVMTFATGYPIEVKPAVNLGHFKVESALGFTEIHFQPEVAGNCEAKIVIPSYGVPPPTTAKTPGYSEVLR